MHDDRRARSGASEPSAPIICGLARASAKDIDRAWEGVTGGDAAAHSHLPRHERAAPEAQAAHEPRARCSSACARWCATRATCATTSSSRPEDAGRSEPEFLCEVLEAAVARRRDDAEHPRHRRLHRARRVRRAHRRHRRSTCRASTASSSRVHCHDDLGLATANTLAGLRAGARQAEVTINGIGERAGNCVARRGRDGAAHAPARCSGCAPGSTRRSSRAPARLVGDVHRHGRCRRTRPIVGANAFAHESGIHQDGMLKHAATYEIMRPGDRRRERDAARARQALGAPRLRACAWASSATRSTRRSSTRRFARFKTLGRRPRSDHRRRSGGAGRRRVCRARDDCGGSTGCRSAAARCGMPTATVRLRGPDGETARRTPSVGTGPVDAAYHGHRRDRATRRRRSSSTRVRAVTEGIDALGRGQRARARVGSERRTAQRAARLRRARHRGTGTAPTPTSSSPASRPTSARSIACWRRTACDAATGRRRRGG